MENKPYICFRNIPKAGKSAAAGSTESQGWKTRCRWQHGIPRLENMLPLAARNPKAGKHAAVGSMKSQDWKARCRWQYEIPKLESTPLLAALNPNQ
ncbi:hypothetical protein [Phocaeicola salanitronis]|uniref:hypothetical protein n=1 Tax=Phocaeicola salanitronis TaxID=376805 RepID=UPI00117F853E|nr:hypothetical protein [Phocaeicola salanitronis]